MSKGSNSKLKLLYLRDMFLQKTDKDHTMTAPEIISYLNQNDISADRKTLYDDFEALTHYGLEIQKEEARKSRGYYTEDRPFELAELKLLIDSVQSSKFISEAKTVALINKIAKLSSAHEAQQLHRQVVIRNRVKSMSKGNVLYTVDTLHTAISTDQQISFRYYDYDVKKQQRSKGDKYIQSPFALIYADDYYYLLAYDAPANKLKHFRVDKMAEVQKLDDTPREGVEQFKKIDMATYTKHTFGMFGGEPTEVTLRFINALAGVVVDRFGHTVNMIPVDEGHFTICVPVVVSDQFLAWVFGFGARVKILSPAPAVEKMRALLTKVQSRYGEADL